jgi:Transglutaminase-like superfamily
MGRGSEAPAASVASPAPSTGDHPLFVAFAGATRRKSAPSAATRLRFRLHLWLAARWLPVPAKRRGIERLLAAATPAPGRTPYGGLAAGEIVAAVRRTLARPWRMRGRRCLRSALLTFRFLRLAGYPAVVHFAVAPGREGAGPMRAHAWVSLDGACLLDPPSPGMVALFAWDGMAQLADA